MTAPQEREDGPAKIAVIGCGHWAVEAHLPALAKDPRAEVVAICDPDPGNRAYAARRFGVQVVFDDAEALLAAARPEGVVVAVPHVYHSPLGMAVLEAGAHLLIEKPFVLDPADGRELVRVARERDREIIVGYPWHYSPHALEFRARLGAGAIGEVQSISCLFASTVFDFYRGDTTADQEADGYAIPPQPSTYSDPAIAGGGQGQTQLTHAVALLLFVTGLRFRRVAAFTERLGLGVDVVDAVAARFENGALAAFSSTGTVHSGLPTRLEYRIYGDRGHAVWDVRAGRAGIHVLGADGPAEPPVPLAGCSYPVHAPATNLVDVVLGVGVNGSPPDVGLHTVEFLDAMYRSAADDGAPVDLRNINAKGDE